MPTLITIARDALRGGRTISYGDHRDQRIELHLPSGPAPANGWPTVIVIHGGSWSARYSKLVMRPICADLVRRGWACWNVEYRRLGERSGGGWPNTFTDVAAAVDAIADVDAPLDRDRLLLLGHSAGGHLALWAASRRRLPMGAPGADPRVMPVAVIAQAPVADLERRGLMTAPGGIAYRLLDGGPDDVPERYAVGNPQRLVALPIPSLLIHGTDDTVVGPGQSRDYHEANLAAGGTGELVLTPGGHREHIDPRTASWAAVTERLDALAARPAVVAAS